MEKMSNNIFYIFEIHDNLEQLFLLMIFSLRGSLFRFSKTINIHPIEIYIWDNAIKTNIEYKMILEKNKDNEKAFLFKTPNF